MQHCARSSTSAVRLLQLRPRGCCMRRSGVVVLCRLVSATGRQSSSAAAPFPPPTPSAQHTLSRAAIAGSTGGAVGGGSARAGRQRLVPLQAAARSRMADSEPVIKRVKLESPQSEQSGRFLHAHHHCVCCGLTALDRCSAASLAALAKQQRKPLLIAAELWRAHTRTPSQSDDYPVCITTVVPALINSRSLQRRRQHRGRRRSRQRLAPQAPAVPVTRQHAHWQQPTTNPRCWRAQGAGSRNRGCSSTACRCSSQGVSGSCRTPRCAPSSSSQRCHRPACSPPAAAAAAAS